MGLYEMLFILQFLVVMGVFFAKFYNIMSVGSKFSIKMCFLLYVGFLLAYFTGLTTTLLGFDELFYYRILYYRIFSLEILILLLTTLFTVIELFIYLGNKAVGVTKSRNSRALYGGKE